MNCPAKLPSLLLPADLSETEKRARAFDLASVEFHPIVSPTHVYFEQAYSQLWKEFGSKDEMESLDVIGKRLARDPHIPIDSLHLLYELLYARDTTTGAFAAVRDHTAIAMANAQPPAVVVHLSHVLVAPAHRGSGLAGWMRTFPIATARECAKAVWGDAVQPGITLVAEMEHVDESDPATIGRLIAYEKAGFLKVDPAVVDYWQPDFRDAAAIDASGAVQPIPMNLVLRRVGRETETNITGQELKQIVTSLYGMYAADFRKQDMQVVYDHMNKSMPTDDAIIRLIAPTAR